MKVKFFSFFRVLYPIGSQAYKLELLKWWRIYDVFHISLLEQDITKKGQVDKKTVEQLEFEVGSNNKDYKVEGICDSAVYAKESEIGHLSGFYYLVSWKSYLENKNIWEPTSEVQYLQKLVSNFYKNHPNKLIATSPPIDLAPPIAKYTALPNINSK